MKKIFVGICAFLLVCGVVYAASLIIYNNSNYKINSGGAEMVMNKKAKYKNAKAEFDIESTTNGIQKTKFVVYKLENGTNVKKATKIIGITPWTCQNIVIGTIGKGKWSIANQAFDGSNKLAGWNGSLKYISVS